MLCKICNFELKTKKSKNVCGICYNKKHEIKCVNCSKRYEVTANYFIKIDKDNHICKQCKLKGTGNPNYNKKWSNESKLKQSNLIKSKVDEKYRSDCAKGMKGKSVSQKTINMRLETMMERYGKLSLITGHTEETLKIISKKSKEKFTLEYKKKIRKINEDKNTWVKLENKSDYHFYREISNWVGQVISNKTVGVEKLKTNKFYSKDNKHKDALIRDHMYSRKMGFLESVFPEILKHPANCQIISHGENVKKSHKKNDCVIDKYELFEKIKNWDSFYDKQDEVINLIEKYNQGYRYNKNEYINKFYGNT